MAETLDEGGCDQGRVRGPIAPDPLERLVGGTDRIAFDHEDVPFDDVLKPCPSRRESRLDVRQDLRGLRCQVALADDLTVGPDRISCPPT